MRVFDIYTYNIASKVKIKDTKKFIDKMLADLGLQYEEISFDIQDGMTDIETVVEKYPNLDKYRYYYEAYGEDVLTSLTPEWKRGNVCAKAEDWDSVFDLFSKIPRGFNINGTVILHHIDWYGEGTKKLAIGGNEFDRGQAIICDDYSVLSNSIHMMRKFSDGNKNNTLKVMVEATSDGVPKNTEEVIKKLKKYIGKPESYIRRCAFDDDKAKAFWNYQVEARKLLEEKLNNDFQVNNEEYVKRMSDPFIPALVDKKMIKKAYADTSFSMDNKKNLSGANTLNSIDKHNYLYEVVIDRTKNCPSFFRFYIYIRGCNFQISNLQNVVFADSREEAEEKLVQLADYCMKLQDEFGDYLSERFGDTPEWYKWKE